MALLTEIRELLGSLIDILLYISAETSLNTESVVQDVIYFSTFKYNKDKLSTAHISDLNMTSVALQGK